MGEKKTIELMSVLGGVRTEKELDAYISREDMNDMIKFAEYFNELECVRSKTPAEIIKKSCVNRKYGSEMLSYKCSKNLGRDRIIALMIAGGLNIDEVQRGLEIANVNPLYSRDRRDAVIIFGINLKKSVIEINLLLDERGFAGLEGTYEK